MVSLCDELDDLIGKLLVMLQKNDVHKISANRLGYKSSKLLPNPTV